MKRLHTILIVASGIVCCLLIAVLPFTYRLGLWKTDSKSRKLLPHDYSITITPHLRSEFYRGGILLFNSESPFWGGIRHMADSKGIFYKGGQAHEVSDWTVVFGDYGFVQKSLIGEKNEFVEKDRSLDFPGIIYRSWFAAAYPQMEWILKVSLWHPILCVATLPALWIYRRFRFRTNKHEPAT